VYRGLEDEALGVYQDVTLSAFDLLASYSITTIFSAHRCSLYRLGINHASAWLEISPQANPEAFTDNPMDPLPGAVDAPLSEVMVDDGPPGEVMGEQAPLATAL
jgi:hypothetical protein